MLHGKSIYTIKEEFHDTWHAHLYSKPPAQPTPHFINDILGLSKTKSEGRTALEKKDEKSACSRKARVKSKNRLRSVKAPFKLDAFDGRLKASTIVIILTVGDRNHRYET